jgi:Xaa-Pro aminopeptidase
MTTYLLHADPLSSPELRHEVAEAVPDPLVFVEHDDRRVVVGSILEKEMFSRREDVVDEYWTYNELGQEDLLRDETYPAHMIDAEMALRVVKRIGVSEVIVPDTFRLGTADHLRAHGIDVVVDGPAWQGRRRIKAHWEIEGIERAQRAVETAFLTAARMLREAEPTQGDRLRFEGEILTAELIREAMEAEIRSQGAEVDGTLVQSGDACLSGHDIGTGPILPNQSCVIDCFPQDRHTGCFTDMTRTFVPGEPSEDLRSLHRHCLRALEIAYDSIKPGTSSAYDAVADYFHSEGFPTRKHHEGPDALTHGFFHSLGHGVGLQVHESPSMGLKAQEFVAGDVVAVEPGLYFEGIGGVRLEDTVLVTDDGIRQFTDPYPYDLEP